MELTDKQISKLLDCIKSIKASAAVLLDEATETEKEIERFYAPFPRKGKGLSAQQKAGISKLVEKASAHK